MIANAVKTEDTYLAIKVGESCHVRQANQDHELPVIKWIQENVKTDMAVMDIGANNGYFTTLFSRQVGERGVVYAFEPDSRNTSLLRHTIELNTLKNVAVLPIAIHDYVGSIQFGISEDCAWSGINSNRASKWINVPCASIDALTFSGMDRIDVVKIDVEGTELNVIQGAMDTMKHFAPTFLIELHGTEEEERNHPVFNLLHESNYTWEYLIEPWFIVAKKN